MTKRNRPRLRLEQLEDRCLLSITEFPVPTPSATPWSITPGPDGNLWFTERDGNKIGEINPTTHAIKEFSTPTANPSPWSITTGPDGNLWFPEFAAGQIGMINPTTHAVTELPIPYTNAAPKGITAGPDGNLWFADYGTSSIGVISPDTSRFVVTQQPPSKVTAGTPFGLTVEVEDGSGDLEPTFNGAVMVALENNGGGVLGGTLTVTASQGVATFSGLELTTVASDDTLVVSGNGLGDATTSAIKVTPGTASQLVISQQPSLTATAGVKFATQPIVGVEDRFGNLIKSDSADTVTAARGSLGTASLQGTALTVTLVNGVATFSGLYYNQAETMNIVFTTSASAVTSATSSNVVVHLAQASQLVVPALPVIDENNRIGNLETGDNNDLAHITAQTITLKLTRDSLTPASTLAHTGVPAAGNQASAPLRSGAGRLHSGRTVAVSAGPRVSILTAKMVDSVLSEIGSMRSLLNFVRGTANP
jgi:hypothetical protein